MLMCFINIARIPGLTLQTDTQMQEPADSKSFFPIYQRKRYKSLAVIP